MALATKPLRVLSHPSTPMGPDAAATGKLVPPLTQMRQFSPSDWEDFVVEWADSLKKKYGLVEKCAGAGDMGRDVVAFKSANRIDPWDNYQCKQYRAPLAPSDIWIELGKLAYYSFINEYSLPRAYVFVAPQGAGNTLSKLLKDPPTLRSELLAAWSGHCATKITSTKRVALSVRLRAHINGMDFSMFRAATPHDLVKQHRKTFWFVYRFGGGLPERDRPPAPPTTHAPKESTYVRALLDAYEERLRCALASAAALTDATLATHLERARCEFYSAESLKAFSKDNVPHGTFEGLLDDVHNGVADVLEEEHTDGYGRVLAAVKQAKTLALTSNALVTRTSSLDRGGMCHQLANEGTLRWRR